MALKRSMPFSSVVEISKVQNSIAKFQNWSQSREEPHHFCGAGCWIVERPPAPSRIINILYGFLFLKIVFYFFTIHILKYFGARAGAK
jgi:hypothetical protein